MSLYKRLHEVQQGPAAAGSTGMAPGLLQSGPPPTQTALARD